MTKEEAKRWIHRKFDSGETEKLMADLIIKALEQEPSGDLISRQADNLCSSCTNIGCEFQSGIVRTKCAFYMPPHIESDNCGNYVVMQPVNPQEPKTGHWEWVQYDYNPKLGNYHCSECRCVVIECVGKKEKGGIPLYKYCPQCGTKMESEENDDNNNR